MYGNTEFNCVYAFLYWALTLCVCVCIQMINWAHRAAGEPTPTWGPCGVVPDLAKKEQEALSKAQGTTQTSAAQRTPQREKKLSFREKRRFFFFSARNWIEIENIQGFLNATLVFGALSCDKYIMQCALWQMKYNKDFMRINMYRYCINFMLICCIT